MYIPLNRLHVFSQYKKMRHHNNTSRAFISGLTYMIYAGKTRMWRDREAGRQDSSELEPNRTGLAWPGWLFQTHRSDSDRHSDRQAPGGLGSGELLFGERHGVTVARVRHRDRDRALKRHASDCPENRRPGAVRVACCPSHHTSSPSLPRVSVGRTAWATGTVCERPAIRLAGPKCCPS
jgi:hypothetical protein